MSAVTAKPTRVFKTAWFAKVARKARIKDEELCKAISQVIKGQCDDLGGGVFKKRLNKNHYRAIIIAKAGGYWIYEYLFAKKDRANIEDNELAAFRLLAKSYGGLSDKQIGLFLADGDMMEICNDDQSKI